MALQSILERPELLVGPNPFIEGNDPYIPYQELASRLNRNALKAVNWHGMPPSHRSPYLNLRTLHFAAHRNILDAAADLQQLFRAGLVGRDPNREGEVARTNRIAVARGFKDLLHVGDIGGGGGIWAAITASGKSALALRLLECICTRRVIPMGSSQVYGWDNLIHVPYLYIETATNGSRGGILHRVLAAIDRLIGTSYSTDYKNVRNLDTLLVEVCRKLSNIRCVLLVIDEKQQTNFEDSPWRLEFVLFYMSLMNLGINVLLLGNPLAFSHLEMFSQVMRRFSVAGHHKFLPAATADEAWWSKDFMPRVRKFNLVERWDVDEATRSAYEFKNSGGVPGLATAYQAEVQSQALRRTGAGAEAWVIADDFEKAAVSPTFVEQRKIALAVRGELSALEAPFVDIDAAGASRGGSAVEGATGVARPSDSAVSMVQRLLARHSAEASRRTKDLVSRLKSLQGLSPEHLEMLSIQQHHINELHAVVGKMSDKAKKGKTTKVGSAESPQSSDADVPRASAAEDA